MRLSKRAPSPWCFRRATYGVPEKIPIPEEHPQRPINPYGFSKLVVERMLADLGHAYGLRSIALRYFNAAGADPEGDIGETHDPEPHLIPSILAAARDGTAVTVYGNDYETPDGTCIRDYIHVSDLADAHVRALDYLRSGGSSCALNLANARGHSPGLALQQLMRSSQPSNRLGSGPSTTTRGAGVGCRLRHRNVPALKISVMMTRIYIT